MVELVLSVLSTGVLPSSLHCLHRIGGYVRTVRYSNHPLAGNESTPLHDGLQTARCYADRPGDGRLRSVAIPVCPPDHRRRVRLSPAVDK